MTDFDLLKKAWGMIGMHECYRLDCEHCKTLDVLRERLAQPEQYQRPTMRRATREEKIDRPGVYWVPVNNIANSEAIPEQISEPEQEPVAQGENK